MIDTSKLPRPVTPGPWVVVGEFAEGGLSIEHHEEGNPFHVASCAITYAIGSYIPPLPDDADAIAALPTLWEALDERGAENAQLRSALTSLTEACDPYLTEAAPGEDLSGKWSRTFERLSLAVHRARQVLDGAE